MAKHNFSKSSAADGQGESFWLAIFETLAKMRDFGPPISWKNGRKRFHNTSPTRQDRKFHKD